MCEKCCQRVGVMVLNGREVCADCVSDRRHIASESGRRDDIFTPNWPDPFSG